ncbi:kinase-like domain-containing protein [Mycena leptocephala]|nr:kinase-like domain-containing protein [Mycena leptocephala]
MTVPPENLLPMYTFSLVLQQQSDHWDVFRQLWDFKASLPHGRFLESLTRYRFDLDTLFALLKDCQRSVKNCSTHTYSTDVHKHLNLSISVGVAGLVLFLQDVGSYTEFLTYRSTDAQALLDLLQDFLDLDSFSVVKPFLCKALCRLSQNWSTSGGGGFGDIWKGLVCGQSVCVKIMRLFQNDDIQTVLKEFGREALIWRQLCHPNLLPFFGLYYLDNRLCLVSPWMQNGNIMEFLRREPVNTDRLSLILDVALGLKYLHEQKVVHGDLKAINILVTPSGRACIADFGLSSVENAMTLRFPHSTASTRRGGTPCYHAPELFQGKSITTARMFTPSLILTGQRPFHDLNDMAVMFHIVEGKRPPRPMSCSDSLWELLQNCWVGNTEIRPTAPQIVKWLEGPSIRAITTSSTTDWDNKFTSKFRRSLQTRPLLPSVTQIERMLSAKRLPKCFPDQESSGTGIKKGISELGRQAKRTYEDDHKYVFRFPSP